MLALSASLALLLSHAGLRRAGTNGVWVQGDQQVAAGSTACQEWELLPAGAALLQIPGSTRAPPVVTLRQDGRLVERVVASDAQGLIRAPVGRSVRERVDVQLCLAMRSPADLLVGPTPPGTGALTIDGQAGGSSLPVDYMEGGRRTWWASVPLVARRTCQGHTGFWDPCWNAWAIVVLVGAALLLAGGLVLRTLVTDGQHRWAAVAVAGVAALNAGAWSFITPPFQVPDEVAHVAYVQSMGETGKPPSQPREIVLSQEQTVAMADARFGDMAARTLHAAAWTPVQQRQLALDGRQPSSRQATIPAGEREPEPPLYYALESIPYRVARGSTLLDRIVAMRLLSALLAGATALLCFLFVRECLPGRPWAWTVGGLGVAFAPMLGFISGGVNPDALLYALSAGLFLCVACAWRRGLTTRLALTAGALIAAGALTKVNFFGLVPGAALGLLLAARRTTLAWDRRLLGLVGAAAAAAGLLVALGVGFETLVWHRPFAVGRPAAPESHVGLWGHLSYIWQVFLPRLPFQSPTTLTHPGYEQLFKSFVGTFGWMVVWLPPWAYRAALVALLAFAALALRFLAAEPRELRWRRRELLGYGAMAICLLLLVGLSADLRRDILHIVQGRYLLPLLPLFGVLIAIAARGAGERWGRAVGVAMVAAFVAWSVGGQLVTLVWFYT
ncbi:MAG: DUF2142 domain-containing protein [Actinobacteria bacterium]|nr:DUF2142 domain-containing protein [Actinomycetota bacterium]